jgi:hypothetical protein
MVTGWLAGARHRLMGLNSTVYDPVNMPLSINPLFRHVV